MMKRIVLPLAAACLLGEIAGCARTHRPDANEVSPGVPAGDCSRTSIDWDGVYRGVMPCADCEGIETIITLSKDPAAGRTSGWR